MTLPTGISRPLFDAETVILKRRLHRAILNAVTCDGRQPLGTISQERLMALLYTLVDELMLAAAAANLIGGKQMGTDLVQMFLLAVPEGTRVRTLQLRHAVDEMSAEGRDG